MPWTIGNVDTCSSMRPSSSWPGLSPTRPPSRCVSPWQQRMLQHAARCAFRGLHALAVPYGSHAVNFSAVASSSSSSAAHSMAELVAEVKNGIGFVKLNRPRVLNSLNTSLVDSLQAVYDDWARPGSGVHCIVLSGEGGKAFCAGGDVKWVVQEAMAGRPHVAMDFFRKEYQLDLVIGSLATPHVSLWDGIVMGGGAGISCHGHFRVATEKTVFAMPEVGIGLFPDVGMMHRLVQLPGALGAYLALTGARVTGKDCKDAGLATHYIPSAALPHLLERLQQLGPRAADLSQVNATLCAAEQEAATSSSSSSSSGAPGHKQQGQSLLARLPVINKCFGGSAGGVAGVMAALEQDTWDQEWSSSTLALLKRGSPLSVAVTWSYLARTRSRHLTLAQVLHLDALVAGHFSAGAGDFYEGVRARLIDKDDAPKWKHSSAQQVTEAEVDSFFQPWSPEQQQALQPAGGTPAAASRL